MRKRNKMLTSSKVHPSSLTVVVEGSHPIQLTVLWWKSSQHVRSSSRVRKGIQAWILTGQEQGTLRLDPVQVESSPRHSLLDYIPADIPTEPAPVVMPTSLRMSQKTLQALTSWEERFPTSRHPTGAPQPLRWREPLTTLLNFSQGDKTQTAPVHLQRPGGHWRL